ncbi:MAG: 50S ribosomal protein L13 [Chlamydiales bacterium]|nr:50S ribosomal protein L13 [Chlamydiales bacterium]
MHLRQNTPMLKVEEVERQWLVIDAKGKTLGRLASEIAKILRGKHRPDYTPHVDSGDGVIVINAGEIAVTGNKEAQKIYRSYTGHIGGMREVTFRTMKARKPTEMLRRAVDGMIPATKQGRAQLKRLRLFAGAEHDLAAQQPIKVSV